MDLLSMYWKSWAVEIFEGPNGCEIYEVEVWTDELFGGISRKLLGYNLSQCVIQALDSGEIIKNLSYTLAQSAPSRG